MQPVLQRPWHGVQLRRQEGKRLPSDQSGPSENPAPRELGQLSFPLRGRCGDPSAIREGLEDALATFGQIWLLSFHAGREKAGVGSRGEVVALVPGPSA